jgi:hypothetical protein
MNPDKSDKSRSPVDIKKLKEEHPNDPRIGQGYNDARGEVSDVENPDHHNIRNKSGPQQKRRRLAKIAPPAVNPGYVPEGKKRA